jgi:hypothetical protein
VVELLFIAMRCDDSVVGAQPLVPVFLLQVLISSDSYFGNIYITSTVFLYLHPGHNALAGPTHFDAYVPPAIPVYNSSV